MVIMNKRKINVMHLILSLETGGMERFVYEHCLEIDKNIFNISVCCIDRLGEFYEPLIENGIKIDLLQKNQNHFDWIFPLKLAKYIIKNNIDILHIHSGAFFIGSLAGIFLKRTVIVYTEHGRNLVEPRFMFILDKISSFFCDKIITVSSELEKYMIENIKIHSNKIETITNGVNNKIFNKKNKSIDLISEFELNLDVKIIGSVGRLAVIKNYETLIKAFCDVRKKIPNSILILVGEGPCENDLKVLSRELGVYDSIIFTGNRSDVNDILNLFDVFVLPSLREGTSLSLLEAMASGVPALVTNVGGNPIIIKNGFNGYVVEPKDQFDMADKIIDILINSDIANKFIENSLNLIVKNFSLQKNVEKYMNLYINLFEKNNC